MNLIMKAAAFAREAHKGQMRKYTGEAYVTHPARVAASIMLLTDATEEDVAIGWLHDVLEDTSITFPQLEEVFGFAVASGVRWLTNPSKESKLPRSDRKALDRRQLSLAPDMIKRIKTLDRIDNLMGMAEAPESFRKKYAQESRLLAEIVGAADPGLKQELLDHCDRVERG
jgi:(p)ppGpp synthase/HD superfamily hydrolase